MADRPSHRLVLIIEDDDNIATALEYIIRSTGPICLPAFAARLPFRITGPGSSCGSRAGAGDWQRLGSFSLKITLRSGPARPVCPAD
jgi:hypothetical protein